MPLVAAGGGLSALGSALLGGATAAAAAGTSLLAAKKSRDQAKEDRERTIIDPVDRNRPDDPLAALADNQANLTLRPGGRPIVFKKQGQPY